MPHFSFRSWEYEKLFRKLRFLLVFVVLLVGCQQEENNVEQKSTTKNWGKGTNNKRRREIYSRCYSYICANDEWKNLAEHMELFSKKMPSAEDLKTQKEAAFQKGNKKIELEHIDMKVSKVGYVIVETKEKEVDDSITLQKKKYSMPLEKKRINGRLKRFEQ